NSGRYRPALEVDTKNLAGDRGLRSVTLHETATNFVIAFFSEHAQIIFGSNLRAQINNRKDSPWVTRILRRPRVQACSTSLKASTSSRTRAQGRRGQAIPTGVR